jgi:predicted DNA-binding protein (MmcQ/YjbR family)
MESEVEPELYTAEESSDLQRVNEARILEKLRKICLALPATTETSSWGHPNFRTRRRIYAAFDEYSGRTYVAFIAPPPILEQLDGAPRFRRSGHRDWIMRELEEIDWKELERLLIQAHAMASEPRAAPAPKGRARAKPTRTRRGAADRRRDRR